MSDIRLANDAIGAINMSYANPAEAICKQDPLEKAIEEFSATLNAPHRGIAETFGLRVANRTIEEFSQQICSSNEGPLYSDAILDVPSSKIWSFISRNHFALGIIAEIGTFTSLNHYVKTNR